MAYKLFTREERDRQAFEKYVITPMQTLRINIDQALAGLRIYLGLNPDAGQGGNSDRPHYVPDEARIVIPDLHWGVAGETGAQAALAAFFHEFGHHLHFKYVGEDSTQNPRWQEWAKLTGQTLDFTYKDDWGYPRRYSQEAFANDVQLTLNNAHDVPTQIRRLRWYARLWGQEWRPRIELLVGEREAFVCGRKVALDVPPIILKDRTLVPIRFVAEYLGCEVDWQPKDGYPRTVIIQ
ncbi:MAG: copper amine oxidase N-terminal domain-containing protein [Bacillota bacterium]